MKKTRLCLLGVATLAIIAGSGVATDADADIRVRATVRTPHVRVHVGHPPRHYRIYERDRFPIVRHDYRVTARDRRIAHRLARYAGAPTGKVIQLRRDGYGWFQIGRWLHLPPRVVRAALRHPGRRHVVRVERRVLRCGCDTYCRHAPRYDDDEYDDD